MRWLFVVFIAVTSAAHARDLDRRSCAALAPMLTEEWSVVASHGTSVELCSASACASFDLVSGVARRARKPRPERPAPSAAALFGVRCPAGHDSNFDALPCPALTKKLGWSSQSVAVAAAGKQHIVVLETTDEAITRVHRYDRETLRHVDAFPIAEEGGEPPSVAWPTPTCALVQAGPASSSPAPEYLLCDGAPIVPLTPDLMDSGFNHWTVVAGHLVGISGEAELLRVFALPSGRMVRRGFDPLYASATGLVAGPGKLLGAKNEVMVMSDPDGSRLVAIDPLGTTPLRTWSFDACVLDP